MQFEPAKLSSDAIAPEYRRGCRSGEAPCSLSILRSGIGYWNLAQESQILFRIVLQKRNRSRPGFLGGFLVRTVSLCLPAQNPCPRHQRRAGHTSC